MQTLRERLLAVLRGGTAERIPWNIYAWLLPQTEGGRKMQAKGLGLMGSRRIFREVYTDVTFHEDRWVEDGVPHFRMRADTPVGSLTEESVIEQNYGSRWIRKYFISSPEDYGPAEFLFRHLACEPDYEPWRQAEAEMGAAGIVVGEIIPVPLMTLIVSWMGVEGFAEGVYHNTERFESLLEAVNRVYDRQMQIAAEGPAEVIWYGDNVTGSIVSPRLFERYLAPTYARVLPVLRAAGKIPIAHYDGSNRPLVKALALTGLPVIEAFTPPPGGDLTVHDAKAAWPDKVVWVNFPGALFLEPAQTIHDYMLNLLREGAPGGRLVIGCTEEYPVEEWEKTFTAIGQAMAEYEGLTW
jgi:hypothetical protein